MGSLRTAVVALTWVSTLISGCSFLDDFSDFRVVERRTDGGVDAATDASPPSDGDDTLTPDEFADEFAEKACARTLRCEWKLGLGALIQLICHPAGAERIFEGLIGFDETRFRADEAQRCLDALDSNDCSVRNALFDEACENFIEPSVQPGGSCVADAQCIDGRCAEYENACGAECVGLLGQDDRCTINDECEPSLRCREETCQPPGELDEPCDAADDCGSLLFCEGDSLTCRPLPNIGEPCDLDLSGDPCRGALVCAEDSDTGERRCAEGRMQGQTCSYEQPCRPGLRCSDASGRCVVLSGPGGACTSRDNCPFPFECEDEKCVALPVLDQACRPTLPCMEGACKAGTCQLRANGERCGNSDTFLFTECAGYCDERLEEPRCVSRIRAGEPCTDDEQCQPSAECLFDVDGVQVCTPCG